MKRESFTEVWRLLHCIEDSLDSKDAAETELVYPSTGSTIGLEQ